jgi:Mg2+ and Co2+ transporter CorA
VDDVRLQKQRLLDRLTDIEDELSTQMLVMDMLKERFQNLVDLEFNVASAKTDVRVKAISVLAFAIAPVGFVAVSVLHLYHHNTSS